MVTTSTPRLDRSQFVTTAAGIATVTLASPLTGAPETVAAVVVPDLREKAIGIANDAVERFGPALRRLADA